MSSSDPIIRDLEIMTGAVNYRRWIHSQIKEYLGQRIVELGAGIGNFTEMLLDREQVVAVDNYAPCIEYLKRRFSIYKNIIPVNVDISTPALLELGHHSPDTIVCLNVLEHVMDDVTALSRMFNLLKKGGRLVLFVPAFQPLYGGIDRLVGHHRRYSKKELTKKLAGAGFKIKTASYMNSIGFVGWFLNNRVFGKKEESSTQVKFFDRFIVPWLRNVEHVIKPPFGMSLIAVGGREDN